MRNKLDNKFTHHAFYKGAGITKRDALKRLHEYPDIWLAKKPSKNQSDYLLDDTVYDYVLTDGKYNYKLKDYELEYYLSL